MSQCHKDDLGTAAGLEGVLSGRRLRKRHRSAAARLMGRAGRPRAGARHPGAAARQVEAVHRRGADGGAGQQCACAPDRHHRPFRSPAAGHLPQGRRSKKHQVWHLLPACCIATGTTSSTIGSSLGRQHCITRLRLCASSGKVTCMSAWAVLGLSPCSLCQLSTAICCINKRLVSCSDSARHSLIFQRPPSQGHQLAAGPSRQIRTASVQRNAPTEHQQHVPDGTLLLMLSRSAQHQAVSYVGCKAWQRLSQGHQCCRESVDGGEEAGGRPMHAFALQQLQDDEADEEDDLHVPASSADDKSQVHACFVLLHHKVP